LRRTRERRAKKSWATRRDGIRNSKGRLARTGTDSRDRPVVAKRLAIEMLAKGLPILQSSTRLKVAKAYTPSEFVQRYSNNDHVVRNVGD